MLQKIMIIDDDQRILSVLGLFLRRHGYRPIALVDPTRAVQIASEERPSLIILDLKMPMMDGSATSKALRAIPGMGDIPIILLTAQPVERFNARAGAETWNLALRKPVEFTVLLGAIQSFIGQAA